MGVSSSSASGHSDNSDQFWTAASDEPDGEAPTASACAETALYADPLKEARHFVITQAVDVSRLASLTWEDFLKYISALNERFSFRLKTLLVKIPFTDNNYMHMCVLAFTDAETWSTEVGNTCCLR